MSIMNTISYRQFKITSHAKQRAYERLNISSEDEIKKKAKSAKYNGFHLNSIIKRALNNHNQDVDDTLAAHGLDNEDLSYFINSINLKLGQDERSYYLYQDYIWIFGGKGWRTLLSIIPCSKQDREKAILVKRLGYNKFHELYPDEEYYQDKTDSEFKRMFLCGGKR